MLNRSTAIVRSSAYLDPELLKLEPHLYQFKWYEYREMTPFECNLEFAKAYREAFQDYIYRYYDHTMAKKVKGIDLRHWLYPETPRADRHGIKQAVHAARQFADGLGMRYYDFIMFCMKFGGGRSVKHILRPNQLVPKKPESLTKGEAGRRDIVERTWGRFMENLYHFARTAEQHWKRWRAPEDFTKGETQPRLFRRCGCLRREHPGVPECSLSAKCSALREMAQIV